MLTNCKMCQEGKGQTGCYRGQSRRLHLDWGSGNASLQEEAQIRQGSLPQPSLQLKLPSTSAGCSLAQRPHGTTHTWQVEDKTEKLGLKSSGLIKQEILFVMSFQNPPGLTTTLGFPPSDFTCFTEQFSLAPKMLADLRINQPTPIPSWPHTNVGRTDKGETQARMLPLLRHTNWHW